MRFGYTTRSPLHFHVTLRCYIHITLHLPVDSLVERYDLDTFYIYIPTFRLHCTSMPSHTPHLTLLTGPDAVVIRFTLPIRCDSFGPFPFVDYTVVLRSYDSLFPLLIPFDFEDTTVRFRLHLRCFPLPPTGPTRVRFAFTFTTPHRCGVHHVVCFLYTHVCLFLYMLPLFVVDGISHTLHYTTTYRPVPGIGWLYHRPWPKLCVHACLWRYYILTRNDCRIR